jgi:hypothetical protein
MPLPYEVAVQVVVFNENAKALHAADIEFLHGEFSPLDESQLGIQFTDGHLGIGR